MKAISLTIVGVILAVIFSAAAVRAQVIVPPTAKKFERRGTGSGGGTGASVGLQKREASQQQPRTVTIQYTVVSKDRQWTNADGKNMMARLLAFSAPDAGKPGPVEVIKDGKVRFLMSATKKPIDYPLEKLSQPDQIFVKAIAQAASKGAPNPGIEKEEEESQEPETVQGGGSEGRAGDR